MAKKTKTLAAIPIDSTKHKDSRKNIPTEELRDFVTEDEQKPKTILYPRDPSLDPQLVWKGKDEQDRQDLAVPAVPIYIQEKIHPQAIIEDFRRTAEKAGGAEQEGPDLFSDFNGLPGDFEKRVDFYHHNQHWSNRLILGDSLLVMNSLAEKENLKGQVQTIYFDPPYGIKFGSNWQVSTRKRDVKDGRAEDATRQPEQIRAFRDTWKLGIHSYLAYLRDRLVVARELLTESGSVFVQIGDENVHLVRSIMDEVFGSSNCVCTIAFLTTSGRASATLDAVSDNLLWYGKNSEHLKYRQVWKPRPASTLAEQYTLIEESDGTVRRATEAEILGEKSLPKMARRFMSGDLSSSGASEEGSKPFSFNRKSYSLPANTHWKTSMPGMRMLGFADRLYPIGQRPALQAVRRGLSLDARNESLG